MMTDCLSPESTEREKGNKATELMKPQKNPTRKPFMEYRILHNQVGSVISKYGSQCSKGLPTTVFFSTAPSHRRGRGEADKGVFTVYTATLTKFLQDFLATDYRNFVSVAV